MSNPVKDVPTAREVILNVPLHMIPIGGADYITIRGDEGVCIERAYEQGNFVVANLNKRLPVINALLAEAHRQWLEAQATKEKYEEFPCPTCNGGFVESGLDQPTKFRHELCAGTGKLYRLKGGPDGF